MSNKYRFIHKGKALTREEVDSYPVIVVGGTDERDKVDIFESEDSFTEWAKKSKSATAIPKALETIREARKYANQDNIAAKERQRKLVDRIESDLKELSERTGLSPNSDELLLRATTQAHPFEGPILNFAVLHEHANRQGRWLYLPAGVPFPDLWWHNFQDITSSVGVAGLVILFEHNYFVGRQLWLESGLPFGIPGDSFNLNDFWNDRVSSAFHPLSPGL